MKRFLITLALAATAATAAQADALDALREFGREAKSGRATFTQTVTSPDGKRKKTSSGSFEFQRPNQFRFAYTKPFEQLIVADGHKVWIYDPDLNQASSRKLGDALGATPAALLAGSNFERDFTLKALPSEGGLDWVQATPKQADSTLQSLRLGFKEKTLSTLEIVDGFGQRSRIDFAGLQTNVAVPAERFQFKVPAGADVIEQ